MKTLKKISLLALTLLMLSMLSVFASAASLDLTVGEASFQQGTGTEPVRIPITISNNPGIAGMQFTVTYDSALTLTAIEKGTALTTISPTFPNVFQGNSVELLWGDAVNDSSNGVIATLVFSVPKETRKVYPIELTIEGASDTGMNEVDVNYTNGKISVTGRPMTGVTAKDNTVTYDGQVKNITLSGMPAGATVSYTVNGEEFNGAKDAGTYAVTATVSAAGYEDFVATKTLKINPKALTITGYSTANKEYDGTTTAVITGGTLNGVISGDDLTLKSITGTFADKNVGTRKAVTISVELEGDQKNYTLSKPSSLTASITKKTITVTAIATGKNFGEVDPALTYTYSPELVEDDEFTGALVRKAGENAGVYPISQGTLALSSNYTLTYNGANFTISPKELTESMVADVSPQAYTGSAIKLTPKVTDSTELVNNTDFTYSYENNTYVGTASVKVTGKGNYTSAITKEFAITVANQTPTITATSSVRRGGNTLDLKRLVANAKGTVSFEISGDANGCTLENGVLTSGENEATVKINVAITAKDVNGDSVNEYNAFSLDDAIAVTVTDKLAQAAIRITSGTTVTYGQTLRLTSRGGSGSGAVTYAVTAGTGDATIEGSVLTPTKAGTVTVVATKAEDATYNSISSEPVVITIEKIKVTVPSADTRTYTYNGTEQTYRITENAAYTITGNKETNANESGYTVTVALNNTDTHVWKDGSTDAKTYTFVIRKATVRVTAKAQSIYVNGTVPTLDETSYTVTGLATGETLKTLPTIEYETEPNATSAGSFVIKVFGAEAPDESNYNEVIHTNGTLTVKTKVSYNNIVSMPSIDPEIYTVKFETNGGSSISSATVEENKTLSSPAAPTKEGYTFEGWYTDSALTKAYNFASKVTKNMTLYAKWTKQEAKAYTDVKENDWYYASVTKASNMGLLNGMSENKFAPKENLSRSMLATILYRLAGSPDVKHDNVFTDIKEDSWYTKAIIWASQNGIVNGVGNNKFAPDANVTREQIATMLYRFAELKNTNVTVTEDKTGNYADSTKISSYALNPMKWALANGILNGDSATTVSPTKNATRAEAATLIVRFADLFNK